MPEAGGFMTTSGGPSSSRLMADLAFSHYFALGVVPFHGEMLLDAFSAWLLEDSFFAIRAAALLLCWPPAVLQSSRYLYAVPGTTAQAVDLLLGNKRVLSYGE
jgi:hypothetical protein